jgi:hypothetical protein
MIRTAGPRAKMRLIRIGRRRIPITRKSHAQLAAIAKARNERQQPHRLEELAAISIGQYVIDQVAQLRKKRRPARRRPA